MSITERVAEKISRPLLQRLGDAKKAAPPEFDGQFEKMMTDLQRIRDVFLTEEEWEERLLDRVNSLTRYADEICGDRQNTYDSKLKEMEKEVKWIMEQVNSCLIHSTMASSLSSDKKVEGPQQRDSKQKKSSGWPTVEHDVEEILEAAAKTIIPVKYEDLADHLKPCLLCFSIFPPDCVINKRILIYWWIGEGLVEETQEGTAEQVGYGYFKEILREGWIEPIDRHHTGTIRSCKMHPWIRWMLISIARNAFFFNINEFGRPITNKINDLEPRRACLTQIKEAEPGEREPVIHERLLTWFNIDRRYLKFEKEWASKIKRVVTLQLGNWKSFQSNQPNQPNQSNHIEVEDTEFLTSLGSLRYLKFLSLQGISRIYELHDSIGKLSNLNILDLRACHNLESLTSGITSLKRLTHLDVRECYFLDHLPKGLGALSELQVLKGFVFGTSNSKDACRLAELTKIEKLWKLSINIGGDAKINGDLKELGKFQGLSSLTITWGEAKTRTSTAWTLFRPPPNLEKLDLRCFPDKKMGSWFEPKGLERLRRLYIRGGQLSDLDLGSGKDRDGCWNICILRLRYLKEFVWKWDKATNEKLPYLSRMEIWGCPKLTSHPPLNMHGVWLKGRGEDASAISTLAPPGGTDDNQPITSTVVATPGDPSDGHPTKSSSVAPPGDPRDGHPAINNSSVSPGDPGDDQTTTSSAAPPGEHGDGHPPTTTSVALPSVPGDDHSTSGTGAAPPGDPGDGHPITTTSIALPSDPGNDHPSSSTSVATPSDPDDHHLAPSTGAAPPGDPIDGHPTTTSTLAPPAGTGDDQPITSTVVATPDDPSDGHPTKSSNVAPPGDPRDGHPAINNSSASPGDPGDDRTTTSSSVAPPGDSGDGQPPTTTSVALPSVPGDDHPTSSTGAAPPGNPGDGHPTTTTSVALPSDPGNDRPSSSTSVAPPSS